MYKLGKDGEKELLRALRKIVADSENDYRLIELELNDSPFITIDGDNLPEEYEDVSSIKDMIRNVYFAKPKTIVLWKDGSKTIVTAQKERFDEEKGILMAFYKKMFGKAYMSDLNDVIENAKKQ